MFLQERHGELGAGLAHFNNRNTLEEGWGGEVGKGKGMETSEQDSHRRAEEGGEGGRREEE